MCSRPCICKMRHGPYKEQVCTNVRPQPKINYRETGAEAFESRSARRRLNGLVCHPASQRNISHLLGLAIMLVNSILLMSSLEIEHQVSIHVTGNVENDPWGSAPNGQKQHAGKRCRGRLAAVCAESM
jgi:hypothetical protein